MRFGNNAVFKRAYEFTGEDTTSIGGVTLKSILLLGFVILSAILCMTVIIPQTNVSDGIVIFGYLLSPIITLVLSFIMSFRPESAKLLAIPYAILEGISIGVITALFSLLLGPTGTVLVALALIITMVIFLIAAVLYSVGLVKVTSKFRRFMFILLTSFVLVTIVVSIMSIFVPAISAVFYGSGSIALLVSIFSVGLASVYAFITLDNVKTICDSGLNKNYEWYAAFGIILNIIWLFYEVLRIIIIIFNRSNRN